MSLFILVRYIISVFSVNHTLVCFFQRPNSRMCILEYSEDKYIELCREKECWIIDREIKKRENKNSKKSLHLQGASIDRFAVNCLQFQLSRCCCCCDFLLFITELWTFLLFHDAFFVINIAFQDWHVRAFICLTSLNH